MVIESDVFTRAYFAKARGAHLFAVRRSSGRTRVFVKIQQIESGQTM